MEDIIAKYKRDGRQDVVTKGKKIRGKSKKARGIRKTMETNTSFRDMSNSSLSSYLNQSKRIGSVRPASELEKIAEMQRQYVMAAHTNVFHQQDLIRNFELCGQPQANGVYGILGQAIAGGSWQ